MAKKAEPKTIDAYIRAFPDDVQVILRGIRDTIRQSLPQAVETISYQIPTFKLNGRYVIYFAGWKHHVSVYPIPSGVSPALARQIAPYVKGKGTLQFPLDKPVPFALLKKLVRLLVTDNQSRKS